MSAEITKQPEPRTVSLTLALEEEQSVSLNRFASDRRSRKAIGEHKWFTLLRKRLPTIALELNTTLILVKRDSIGIPGLSALKLATGNTLRGFQRKSDRLTLVCGPQGWFLELSVLIKKKKRAPKENRIHNDAAIFITKATGHRTCSGGLPSLGKKR